MGKIIRKREEFCGSSSSAETVKFDDTKNVKQAILDLTSKVNSYYTEQTPIGTWINGKTIYRKTFVIPYNSCVIDDFANRLIWMSSMTDGTLATNSANTVMKRAYKDLEVSGTETIVSTKLLTNTDAGNTWFEGDIIVSPPAHLTYWFNNNENRIYVVVGPQYQKDATVFYLTLDYTLA